MAELPKFTMSELLDAGVHFGHKTLRWDPKMEPYIFGVRNGIHIIDLQKTMPMLYQALQATYNVAKSNGRVLFVGTKRQASAAIADAAKRCGQYYVNHRWLGGMLTNWNTVSESIKRLQDIEAQLEDQEINLSKKERLQLTRMRDKLENSLGGIREMGGLPDLLFIIDTNKEHIAIQEAKRLGIPVVAVADTNSSPDDIDYLVPGNDDALRSIELYCRLISDAVLNGIEVSLAASGKDMGESVDLPKKTVKVKVEKDSKETADTGAEEKTEATKEKKAASGKTKAATAKKPAAKKAPAKKAGTTKKVEKAADEKAADDTQTEEDNTASDSDAARQAASA